MGHSSHPETRRGAGIQARVALAIGAAPLIVALLDGGFDTGIIASMAAPTAGFGYLEPLIIASLVAFTLLNLACLAPSFSERLRDHAPERRLHRALAIQTAMHLVFGSVAALLSGPLSGWPFLLYFALAAAAPVVVMVRRFRPTGSGAHPSRHDRGAKPLTSRH